MKAGAQDYIMKRHMARLPPAIDRELSEARRARRAKLPKKPCAKARSNFVRHRRRKSRSWGGSRRIAHDFNNIMTTITGHSELLLRQLAPMIRGANTPNKSKSPHAGPRR